MEITLAEIRKKRGYSQRKLAEAFGTSRRNIEDWERGKRVPSFETAVKLSRFLNCSLYDLFRD